MYLKLYMKTHFSDMHYSCAKQGDETVEKWLARAIAGVIEAVGVNYEDSEGFKHKMLKSLKSD